MSLVICTELSGKEQHRQAAAGRMVTSGTLGRVMVITLAQNAKDVGLIVVLGAIFPFSLLPQNRFR